MSKPTLLSDVRIGAGGEEDGSERMDWRTEFDADIDRLTFSDGLRMLHDKTQVHGPAGNDYVRSRLTHSHEVARVGRHLGALFGKRLGDRAPEIAAGSTPADFGQAVVAASLMHDIGNPPFGHTGESAISDFFTGTALGRRMVAGLDTLTAAEVTRFEGNAQGLRVVTKLQGWRPEGGLRLTAAVIAAACKYPFDAASQRSARKKGKYNFFSTERWAIEEAAELTGMRPDGAGGWLRHPLAHLVEAADDICYRIVDVEDAFVMRCISFGEAESLLGAVPGFDDAYGRIETETKKIQRLRSIAITKLIKETETVIAEEMETILDGTNPGDLISRTPSAGALKEIERVTRKDVFGSMERTKTDLLAHKTIRTLLGAYLSAFEAREAGGKTTQLSRQILKSFPHADAVGTGKKDYVRAVLDYVSGMTDNYAISRAGLYDPSLAAAEAPL